MKSGVRKSGWPMPRLITSRPCAINALARASTAKAFSSPRRSKAGTVFSMAHLSGKALISARSSAPDMRIRRAHPTSLRHFVPDVTTPRLAYKQRACEACRGEACEDRERRSVITGAVGARDRHVEHPAHERL